MNSAPYESSTSRIISPGASCFVVGDPTLPLRPLETLLRARSLRPVFQSDLPADGGGVLEAIRQGIMEAGFVIGVFRKGENSNTTFQLGIAAGLRKPLLVVAPPGVRIPFDAAEVVLVRADPKETEAVAFALDQMLAASRPTKASGGVAPRRTHPIGNTARDLLDQLAELRVSQAPDKHLQLETVVQRAIEASGATVASREGGPDPGFDLGVWSDDLDLWVGNPLLVEIKWQLKTVQDVDRVLRGLASSRALWALLVFVQGPPARRLTELEHRGPVLLLSADELLRTLQTRSFADMVRDLRNRRVHGVA
jgi:hypothetical protein